MPLSGRELEIVQRLTDGMPNKIIANELSITEATVKVHLKTILKKIGAQNRTQAAIWAVQRGFSTAPDMLSRVTTCRRSNSSPRPDGCGLVIFQASDKEHILKPGRAPS